MIKPIFLIDLDDTIFQTQRKLSKKQHAFQVAALDRQKEPSSYFTQTQSHFINWLLDYSTLIPVTARSTEQASRVLIDFSSWQIVASGAVIIKPNGSIDNIWQKFIIQKLTEYQSALHNLHADLIQFFEQQNIAAKATINTEYQDIATSVCAKHKNSNLVEELYQAEEYISNDQFYLHKNDNNLTWLPKALSKEAAATYLLRKLQSKELNIPVIGLGDSISDLPFLRHCDWFGSPKKSQLAKELTQIIK